MILPIERNRHNYDQNQIDLIFKKTKNDIIYIKNANFGNIYFSDPKEISEISIRNCKPLVGGERAVETTTV